MAHHRNTIPATFIIDSFTCSAQYTYSLAIWRQLTANVELHGNLFGATFHQLVGRTAHQSFAIVLSGGRQLQRRCGDIAIGRYLAEQNGRVGKLIKVRARQRKSLFWLAECVAQCTHTYTANCQEIRLLLS